MATQTIKNVALIGASGTLGKHILTALLSTPSLNTTVVSRPDSAATFPLDVKVIRVDYSDEDALVKAFEGQDAVIAALSTFVMDLQYKLIDAAVKAKVQRFIPGEFGADLTDLKTFNIVKPMLQGKRDIIDYLKSKEQTGLSWTGVTNGPWFDWALTNGFFDIDLAARSAILYDPEKPALFTSTTLTKVGEAVAAILLHAEETANRHVYLSSFNLTKAELISALEQVSGQKWTLTTASSYDLEKQGREKWANGDMSGAFDLSKVMFSRDGIGADFGLHKSDNKLLGLTDEDLHVEIKRILTAEKLA